ncbi:MAG: hypothetical protein IPM17_06665 [Verrucomicrobia bacterium]|jgi:hypothetical protein|nr:hypothetical protein [Verrucomicrobiota bacterium]
MSETLFPHPEVRRLADENAVLREELVRLLTEAENLVQVVKPNLLAQYQALLGAWELRVLQAQFETARLRRQIELAQASLNRGVPPDLRAIERQLESDFLAWQARLREARDRILAAEMRLKHLLPPAEDREFKALYRTLVKKLHPDVNPPLTGDQRRLWLRVQAAHAAGDLPELRALALLAEKSGPVPPPTKSLDQLRLDQQTLQRQIAELLRRIETIQSQPPFTLRPQLADEAWVAQRRQELEAQIQQVEAQRQALAAHWQRILIGTWHGPLPGNN